MNPYKSIETLYERSKETNKLDFNKVRQAEWLHINQWMLTEKIDGTNIRVLVTNAGIEIKGRSNNASIPSGLEQNIRKIFDHATIMQYFLKGKKNASMPDDWCVTFYGEGYGPGITGSDKMNYRKQELGKGFRCFDVMFGESNWASVSEWQGLCESLNVPTVVTVGFIGAIPIGELGARQMMEDFCAYSPVAFLEADVNIKAEGLVARPMVPLFNRHGERVIWKLTNREFK